MNEEELLEAIQGTGPLETTDDAHSALEAVMETVGERITERQAGDLAATLPEAAAAPLESAQSSEPDPAEAEEFSTKEFLERVTERAGVDAEPLPTTRAVLAAVREAADDAELERTRDQLPGQFDYFFEPGRPMDEAEFLERVDARLPDGVDPEDATRATLETLGERIAGGEAIDLSTYLPRGLRDPLVEAEEDATPFDRESFLEHVGHRADVGTNEPIDVAQAVLGAVGEAAPDAELAKVRTQLPDEFDPLFDAGSADG